MKTMLWLLALCCLAGGCWGEDGSPFAEDGYRLDVECLLVPIAKLSRNPLIRQQVEAYNGSVHPLPSSLDAQWPDLPSSSPLLRAVLDNPATSVMNRFIQLVSLRGEGLLIGRDGGLVAATNHTTDFWQGDEEQFVVVMNAPDIQPHIIAAYNDISAQAVLVKISHPVTADDGEKIGVLVIGFDARVIDFKHYCDSNGAQASH